MKYKNLTLLILLAVLVFGAAIFFQRFQAGASLIWSVSHNGTVLLPLIVVSSLVDSINPCAFSILLVSIIFLFSIGKSKEKILAYGLAYIFGIFAVYLLIGLGLLQALHIFSIPHFMSKVGAAMLIIFGIINILETIFPNFPIRFAIPHSAHSKMNALVEKQELPNMGSTLLVLDPTLAIDSIPCIPSRPLAQGAGVEIT
jgi:cytochrome c biogenesis protein CcdA